MLSREVPIDPAHAALLFVDVQNYNMTAGGGEFAGMEPGEREARHGEFFRTAADVAVPNMRRLQVACRRGGIEVMYTTIESLTLDGRDRSLDYKITGFNVPRGRGMDASLTPSLRKGTRSSFRRHRLPCSSRPISTTCCGTSACGR